MSFEKFQNVTGVSFKKRDAVDVIVVNTELANAEISLHGATVLSYQPTQQKELLWLSKQAVFDGKKAIRGGIPVCWPWFGKAEQAGLQKDLSAHGFVRNQTWALEQVNELRNGHIELLLSISDSPESLAIWPHKFNLMLKVDIGETLSLALSTENLNEHAIQFTEALHTYFNIAEPEELEIDGLQLSTHIDTLYTDRDPEIQINKVQLTPPRDSVYLEQTGTLKLDDNGHRRFIVIEKENSNSSIVWNPGPEIVKGFTDIDNDAWQEFACVESGNIWDEGVEIAPHETHTLKVEYSIESK